MKRDKKSGLKLAILILSGGLELIKINFARQFDVTVGYLLVFKIVC